MTQPGTNAQPQQSSTLSAPVTSGSRFVWYDIMTTDLPGSIAFYTALFGWEHRPWDMGEGGQYDMLYAGEDGIGGLMPMDAAEGIPSHWIGYVSVPDVDGACATADAAGATTCVPPSDIPTVGRFAVVEDPWGAMFSPFRGSGPDMPAPKNPPVGNVAWNEMMSPDPERSAEFYGRLTGWTAEKMDMGPLGFYWLFKRGEDNAAGMMQLPPDAPARAHWLSYVAVADCDASAARITELGGTLLVPPTDIAQWGRFAVARDTAGATFGVLENKQPM